MDRTKTVLICCTLITIFIALSLKLSPAMSGYGLKYPIFSRNFRQDGVIKSRFFPSYNFHLTDPPSHRVVSHSPFMPLLMYVVSLIFGDNPFTYKFVIILIHAFFFAMLGYFSWRWWGGKVAVWAVFFSALSRYAYTFGSIQTFEVFCLLMSFASIFFYFDWLRTGKKGFCVKSALCYLLSLIGDYPGILTGLVIYFHWIIWGRRDKKSIFKLAAFPVITFLFFSIILVWMFYWQLPVKDWFSRINYRLTGNLWGSLLASLFVYNFRYIGWVPILLTLVFLMLWPKKLSSIPDNKLELNLILLLFLGGVFPAIIFGHAYVDHQYFVMTTVPFFSILSARGLCLLIEMVAKPIIRKLIVLAVVFSFLLPLPKAVLRKNVPNKFYSFLLNSSFRIKHYLTKENKLLVLSENNNSSVKVSVFYLFWIPVDSQNMEERWISDISNGEYSLVMSTNEKSFRFMKNNPKATLLIKEGYLAFFKI